MFLNRPILVTMIFLLLVLLGLLFFFQIPVEVKAEKEYPNLYVSIMAPQFSPEQCETELTAPIEGILSAFSEIRSISSTTMQGSATISCELQLSSDPEAVRFLIRDALEAYPFPADVNYQITAYDNSNSEETKPILTYRFYGTRDISAIHQDLEERLKPMIQRHSEIAEINITGGSFSELLIQIDDKKTASLGINKQDIVNSIRAFYKKDDLGFIYENGRNLNLKYNHKRIVPDDIKRIKLFRNSHSFELSQLADFTFQYAEISRISRFNGFPSVTCEIFRKSGTNALSVIETVKNEIEAFKLADDYEYDLVQDQSIAIKNEFKSIAKRAAWSLLAVLLILILFSRSLAEPLVLFAGIFITIACTMIFFKLFNISINFISMAGLALSFGILVDNGIIIFEQFKIKDERSLPEKVKHLLLPVIASTVTTFIALIPFLNIGEKLQDSFGDFALVVVLSLSASLLIGFIVLPNLYLRFCNDSHSFVKVFTRFQTMIEPYIQLTIQYPKTLIFIFIWLIGFPVYLIPDTAFSAVGLEKYKEAIQYGFGGTSNLFFNYVYKGEHYRWGEESYLSIGIKLPFGSRLDQADRIVRQIESNILKEHKSIRMISNISNNYSNIKILFDNPNSSEPYIVKSKAIVMASDIGGAGIYVGGFGQGFSNGGFGGSTMSQTIQIQGYNYDQLKNYANQVADKLKENRRIDKVEISSSSWGTNDNSYLVCRVKKEMIEKYALDMDRIRYDLNVFMNRRSEDLRLDDGYEILRLRLKNKSTENKIESLMKHVYIQDSIQIAYAQLLDLSYAKSPESIKRDNQQYKLFIQYDYKGPYEFASKFQKEFLDKVRLPLGYTLSSREWYFDRSDEKSANYAVLYAVILVFLVTAILYESFRISLLVILAIPAALCGVFFFYYVSDYYFTIASRLALVLSCGIVVNNAILLVDEMLRLNEFMDIKSACIKGTQNRSYAIIMTTITSIFGLIPLLINESIASEDIWQTLSLTLIGALLSSTIIILFVFPALFYQFYKNDSKAKETNKPLEVNS